MPALRNLVLISLVLALSACAQLPKNDSVIASAAYSDTRETALGLSVRERAGSHPGKTGFYALRSGVDALLSRLILAGLAERSLDIQYYIWHKDDTGMLVLGAVLEAAERGLRVRLLLDDINSADIEPMLVAVASHPNVEVRLFNPFAYRGFRAWDFVTRFSQVNRRMHNKSFIADNQVTIVGGRNLGDEYFGARPDLEFGDLDVMAIGEVVPEVSDAFDLYWNSELAYPIEDLQPTASDETRLGEVKNQLREHAEDMRQSPYGDRVRQGRLAEELKQDRQHWQWGDAELMYDHPDKALGQDAEATAHLSHSLAPVFERVEDSMLLVSPYFVPGTEGVDFLTAMAERGVKVRVVTNSLAATDVTVVHSGYARYRKALLQGGGKPLRGQTQCRDAGCQTEWEYIRLIPGQPARQDIFPGRALAVYRVTESGSPFGGYQYRDRDSV